MAMKALFHGACRDCEFFFAVRHGDEFSEELFHVLDVFPSGRWGLPVGPGGERAYCFEVLDGLQSHVSDFLEFAQERVVGLSLCRERDN